MQFHFQLCFQV